MTQPNRPLIEFKAGPVHATVWPERMKRNGRSWDSYSVQVLKTFWDPTDGQHRTTSYFRPSELPQLVLVANEAFKWVSLKQQTGGIGQASGETAHRAAAEQSKDGAANDTGESK